MQMLYVSLPEDLRGAHNSFQVIPTMYLSLEKFTVHLHLKVRHNSVTVPLSTTLWIIPKVEFSGISVKIRVIRFERQ